MVVIKEDKKVAIVIPQNKFRDEEFDIAKRVLMKNGVFVTVASLKKQDVEGMLGTLAIVDMRVESVKVDKVDGILFIGGIGVRELYNNKKVLDLCRQAYELDKVIGATSNAVTILANSGILNGKQATCYHSEAVSLKSNGAIYIPGGVVIDGKIVTSSGHHFIKAFIKEFLELLKFSF